MTRRAALLVLLSLLAFATPARPQPPAAVEARARHVILFLADAGGIPTIHAASLLATGSPRGLFVQRMPHIALVDTSAADEWVTDSAAGMTAIVTGRKTNNGVLSQGPDAVRRQSDGTPLESILEYAEAHGLSTGIVTNDSVAGATPAALYAKSNDRGKAAEIILQAFSPRQGDGVDVLIGPGRTELAQAVAAGRPDLSCRRRGGAPQAADRCLAGAGRRARGRWCCTTGRSSTSPRRSARHGRCSRGTRGDPS